MKVKELVERYGIDLKKLESEQLKLAKQVELKDALDFSACSRIGAVENLIVKNKIISAAVVCNKNQNFEIVEQGYFIDKLNFPFIHGFRAYREMPAMVEAYNKLNEKPDIIFIHGHGTCHPRLGLASHFSIVTGVPSIGVSDKIFEGNKLKSGNVLMKGRVVGRLLESKQGAKPLCICPGSRISVESAYNLIKRLLVEPHKLPEPMHIAHKYAKEIQKELKLI